jgi:hypothetical protein
LPSAKFRERFLSGDRAAVAMTVCDGKGRADLRRFPTAQAGTVKTAGDLLSVTLDLKTVRSIGQPFLYEKEKSRI